MYNSAYAAGIGKQAVLIKSRYEPVDHRFMEAEAWLCFSVIAMNRGLQEYQRNRTLIKEI
ncbi:hypothetical protein DXT99_06345 [Pontibacter diazotrophicus]|uniref:Uncharacterized protein n=1 Tax=Pontibacter diazotrophicus TaxID=1400979 RepID=A0A3D8LEX7_9BACT|nr:hypothetical protein DXT99_06345 [Pontibacter diazotrophicus]